MRFYLDTDDYESIKIEMSDKDDIDARLYDLHNYLVDNIVLTLDKKYRDKEE